MNSAIVFGHRLTGTSTHRLTHGPDEAIDGLIDGHRQLSKNCDPKKSLFLLLKFLERMADSRVAPAVVFVRGVAVLFSETKRLINGFID